MGLCIWKYGNREFSCSYETTKDGEEGTKHQKGTHFFVCKSKNNSVVSTYIHSILHTRLWTDNNMPDKPAFQGFTAPEGRQGLSMLMIVPYSGKHQWLREHTCRTPDPVFGSKTITSKLSSKCCLEVTHIRLHRREHPRKRNNVCKGAGVWGAGLALSGRDVEQGEDVGEKEGWGEETSCFRPKMGAWQVTFLRELGSHWSTGRAQMTSREYKAEIRATEAGHLEAGSVI